MEIKEIQAQQTWQLRQQVMWPDKDITQVMLADDDEGMHYGLYRGDQLMSVISVFVSQGELQFRKFATVTELQGQGFGTQLLNFVLTKSRQSGIGVVWCNARSNKAGFYRRFGLQETGEPFNKDGREYIKMSNQNNAY
jgi:predicted GNAT family N-acyltransferase